MALALPQQTPRRMPSLPDTERRRALQRLYMRRAKIENLIEALQQYADATAANGAADIVVLPRRVR